MDQILSVCTGIGGLDLGLHAGLQAVGREARTVCMVEREAFAVAVLGKAIEEGRLDDCPIWLGDLRDLPSHELPRVDWITGGYPCQPFSQAGKRLGADDPRHLWPVIVDCIRSIRPRSVFFENVSGHMSLGLDRVLQDLAGCGFRCAFGLFTAAEVGAPHRRERVFILGMADAEIVGGREGRTEWSGRIRLAPSHGSGPELADAESIDRRTGSGRSEDGEEPAARGQLADADLSRRREDREPDEQGSGRPLESSGDQIVADTDGSGRQGRRRLRECPFERISRPGCPQGPNEPPRTIERGLGRGSHGLSDRVDRLRALGNAVVPQQAELAFIRLWNLLQETA